MSNLTPLFTVTDGTRTATIVAFPGWFDALEGGTPMEFLRTTTEEVIGALIAAWATRGAVTVTPVTG